VTVGLSRAGWRIKNIINRLAGSTAEARRALKGMVQQPDGHRPFEHPFYWGAFICQGDTGPLARGAASSAP